MTRVLRKCPPSRDVWMHLLTHLFFLLKKKKHHSHLCLKLLIDQRKRISLWINRWFKIVISKQVISRKSSKFKLYQWFSFSTNIHFHSLRFLFSSKLPSILYFLYCHRFLDVINIPAKPFYTYFCWIRIQNDFLENTKTKIW